MLGLPSDVRACLFDLECILDHAERLIDAGKKSARSTRKAARAATKR